MNIVNSTLDGVLRINLDAFEDHRGYYLETYNEKIYESSGIDIKFIQDDISVSSKNVLRGIHGDQETWKLISCLQGEYYLVVVNCDKTSSQYKKWESFTLSEHNRVQILVPPRFGNGHLVMSDRTIFHYKQSTYYNPRGQFTIRWNDPEYNIKWPSTSPILSKRDEIGYFEK